MFKNKFPRVNKPGLYQGVPIMQGMDASELYRRRRRASQEHANTISGSWDYDNFGEDFDANLHFSTNYHRINSGIETDLASAAYTYFEYEPNTYLQWSGWVHATTSVFN